MSSLNSTSRIALLLSMPIFAISTAAVSETESAKPAASTMNYSNAPLTAQAFVTQAATSDKAEIEIGQIALRNAQSQEVKDFAQRMVKDHTASSEKLKPIAAKENLKLPTALDAEHQALKTKLSGLQGDAFDKEYAAAMTKGHDKAVALFQSASQSQQLPTDLKNFAAATLPTIKDHQQHTHALD